MKVLGVHIFFIISGFLITTLLLKEKLLNQQVSLKRFYMRRALRILPVAWLYLLALLILRPIYHLSISMADFMASLLFLKNLPMPNEPFTAHFWSLAVEEQFYLVFPVIIVWAPKKYNVIALLIAFGIPLLAIMGNYVNPTIPWLHWLFKLSRYTFWKGPTMIMLGAVLALLLFKRIIKPEQLKVNPYVSICLMAVALIISSRTFCWYESYISTYLAALLAAIAILLCITQQSVLSRLLRSKFMVRIGILSYSIYMWQELFISNRPWQPWLHFLHGFPIWQVIIVKLVLIAVIASLSFRFESIFLKLKKHFEPKLTITKQQ